MGRHVHVFSRECCSKVVLSLETDRMKRRHGDFVGLTKRDDAISQSSVRVSAGRRAWRASEAVTCMLMRAVSSANRLQENLPQIDKRRLEGLMCI